MASSQGNSKDQDPQISLEELVESVSDWIVSASVPPEHRRPEQRDRSPMQVPGLPSAGEAPLPGRPTAPRRAHIGWYRLTKALSRSLTGWVIEAESEDSRRPALLKVIDSRSPGDSRLPKNDWIQLFDREGELLSSLSHEDLPKVIERGRDGSLNFVAYERAPGTPLNEILARGDPMTDSAIIDVVSRAARALHYLHENGVVYCNVRSHAIFVGDRGSPVLSDFSMAARTEEMLHPLLPENPFVLAPEYLSRRVYGPEADQFALGALLYEMLTGTRPFRGLEDHAILAAIRERTPKPPSEIDSRIPEALSSVAMKMLSKEPGQRFASCSAVASALGR